MLSWGSWRAAVWFVPGSSVGHGCTLVCMNIAVGFDCTLSCVSLGVHTNVALLRQLHPYPVYGALVHWWCLTEVQFGGAMCRLPQVCSLVGSSWKNGQSHVERPLRRPLTPQARVANTCAIPINPIMSKGDDGEGFGPVKPTVIRSKQSSVSSAGDPSE